MLSLAKLLGVASTKHIAIMYTNLTLTIE